MEERNFKRISWVIFIWIQVSLVWKWVLRKKIFFFFFLKKIETDNWKSKKSRLLREWLRYATLQYKTPFRSWSQMGWNRKELMTSNFTYYFCFPPPPSCLSDFLTCLWGDLNCLKHKRRDCLCILSFVLPFPPSSLSNNNNKWANEKNRIKLIELQYFQ